MKRGTPSPEQRLRVVLLSFLLAVCVPAGLLVYKAWTQVRWQVFHEHRLLAERLVAAADARLAAAVQSEEARAFDEYAFLLPADGRRSPLSAFPVSESLPGLVGYFQVDSAGRYSSPLLPVTDAGDALTAAEREARERADERVRAVLSTPPLRTAGVSPDIELAEELVAEAAGFEAADDTSADADALAEGNVFERLVQSVSGRQSRTSNYGRVDELELDARLESKSRDAVASAPKLQTLRKRRKEQVAVIDEDRLAPRLERGMIASAVPESAPLLAGKAGAPSAAMFGMVPGAVSSDIAPAPLDAPAPTSTSSKSLEAGARPAPVENRARVRVFESELDPMNFMHLDADHFVLYRNAWRDGQRFIQGALIDRERFFEQALRAPWRGSSLAAHTSLLIAWSGEVVALGDEAKSATSAMPDGDLLYRTRLSAPLADLEVLLGVTELPLGAAASYLLWVGLALVAVLLAGGYAFYRFSLGHLRLSRQQQDFVSAVSHELKTPLTSIRMYSEMLVAGWGDEDKRRGWYRFINDESERLSRLIENVLRLARISRGQAAVELRGHAAGDLLARMRPLLEAQVQAAGFTLETDFEEAACGARIDADEDALAQILTNLVDNAIKFTPGDGGGHVELSCRTHGPGAIRIAVRDYGAGIPREQMRRIFELFYRVENELTRETVGTGIGLALVRQLVDAMSGRIEVVNCDPGAEFRIELPVSVAGGD